MTKYFFIIWGIFHLMLGVITAALAVRVFRNRTPEGQKNKKLKKYYTVRILSDLGVGIGLISSPNEPARMFDAYPFLWLVLLFFIYLAIKYPKIFDYNPYPDEEEASS